MPGRQKAANRFHHIFEQLDAIFTDRSLPDVPTVLHDDLIGLAAWVLRQSETESAKRQGIPPMSEAVLTELVAGEHKGDVTSLMLFAIHWGYLRGCRDMLDRASE